MKLLLFPILVGILQGVSLGQVSPSLDNSDVLVQAIAAKDTRKIYHALSKFEDDTHPISDKALLSLWKALCSDESDRVTLPDPRTPATVRLATWRGLARDLVWANASRLSNEIVASMTNPHRRIRREGIVASKHLKEHGGVVCFKILEENLNDNTHLVRMAAIDAISQHGMKSEDPLFRRIQKCIGRKKGTRFSTYDESELKLICSTFVESKSRSFRKRSTEPLYPNPA